MDKKIISHAIATITTPFYFSFILAIVYALYYKEYSNILEGTPVIIFMTMILYLFAAPFILLIDMVPKKINIPLLIKVIVVAGTITGILNLTFSQSKKFDFDLIILGALSGFIYFFNEYIITKYILNKLKFLNEHS